MTTIWVIYQRPTDYRQCPFVVREYNVEKGQSIPSGVLYTARTLQQARKCIPDGAQRVRRDDGDEPQIVEWWFGRPQDEPETSG
jgi:hypothetical protein